VAAGGVSRRTALGFLSLGTLGLAGAVPGAGEASPAPERAGAVGRLARAHGVRRSAADLALGRGGATHRANGDEERLPGRIACFTKGLPHDTAGRVDPAAYDVLLRALATGDPADFERVPLGGYARLANPQAAWAYELIGPDPSQPYLPPAPALDSAEQAAELVELYWHALAREVSFGRYGEDATVARAAEDLSRFEGYTGPRRSGAVTADLLFRGSAEGDAVGPYLSQFLWQPIPWTPIRVEQRIRTAVSGLDYLAGYDDWLAVQRGALAGVNRFDSQARYIRNGRDLGEYVHRDFTYQAFLGACLAALKMGSPADGGNPYKHSRTQGAFTTFGQPYMLYLLAVVTQSALKACWYQKWRVHRRLRPEELTGHWAAHRRGLAELPMHQDLAGSAAAAETLEATSDVLLPQAYPEGCPLHPSYPAGHAVIGGACVTVLKACLDESYELPNPVVARDDGLALEPWKGEPLTLGGELDKLAANIAFGRNFAGIHWRSDAEAGLALGEEVAIAVLEELRLTGSELFAGYSLRRFDGRRVVVG
jgi:membrane-associated phospholipid phosphatase